MKKQKFLILRNGRFVEIELVFPNPETKLPNLQEKKNTLQYRDGTEVKNGKNVRTFIYHFDPNNPFHQPFSKCQDCGEDAKSILIHYKSDGTSCVFGACDWELCDGMNGG